MSNFQREITKQILSAPACSMRSIRYSLTARGRSAPPSKRLPTGSNSFEKASGWMRVPLPAAGIIPHMVSALHAFGFMVFGRTGACVLQQRDQLGGTALGGVLGKDPLPPRLADVGEFPVAEIERRKHVIGLANDDDVAPG